MFLGGFLCAEQGDFQYSAGVEILHSISFHSIQNDIVALRCHHHQNNASFAEHRKLFNLPTK